MAAEGLGQGPAEQAGTEQEGYQQAQRGLAAEESGGAQELLEPRLEALLFVAGEPVSLATLAEVLGARPSEVDRAAQRLIRSLEGRGLTVVRTSGTVQLTTSPLAAADIARFLHSEEAVTLSGAAMETLALIAYRQPITRVQIEAVRGVSSESPLRTLLRLGLVIELERLDQPGRPISYGTTAAFLRLFGLASTDELPPLPDGPLP